MKRIYLSGKITGLEKEEVAYRFDKAKVLASHIHGLKGEHIDISDPSFLEGDMPGATYEAYMKQALINMLECEEIYMLKEWETSRGACLELQVAAACGLKINFL